MTQWARSDLAPVIRAYFITAVYHFFLSNRIFYEIELPYYFLSRLGEETFIML